MSKYTELREKCLQELNQVEHQYANTNIKIDKIILHIFTKYSNELSQYYSKSNNYRIKQ
jgi:hypothetical protein